MNENLRFISIIDELKSKGVVAGFVQVAVKIQTNKAGIGVIISGLKELSIYQLLGVKLP